MEFVRDFNSISKNDVALAGGKGASLGEMTHAGIPVPPGFVILAAAFERFFEETDLNVEVDATLDSVNHKEMHTVENASEKIQALILEAEMPEDIMIEIRKFFKNLGTKYVAVRSSATVEDSASAAWAGQLDSFLNTTEQTLLQNVKKCWASLFTPRAIFYRFEKDLHKQKISVAVVVQKMVESEMSGIAFSVHPVTQDRNQLIIEAGFGLGEAIVSGQITPDSYVVEKEPRRIIDKNVQAQTRALYRAKNGGNKWRDIPKEIGETQVLTDDQILELSNIILRIENHYGFPVDVEWARESEKFYIVQSRPITTLTSMKVSAKLNKLFTREISLFYSFMWCDTDTRFVEKWLGFNFKNILFLKQSESDKVSIWYDPVELKKAGETIRAKIASDKNYFLQIKKTHDYYWNKLFLYLKKGIGSISELEDYYNNWSLWLAVMRVMFIIPYIEGIPEEIQQSASAIRKISEPYADREDQIFADFFKRSFPEYKAFALVITPQEVFSLATKSFEPKRIVEIRDRLDGFGLLNGEIFPIRLFEEKVDKYSVILDTEEKIEIKEKLRIKGSGAFPGIVQGKVHLLLHKNDISRFRDGEILVTEMTSPDFVPAMKKAVAIITDEGGITSHAAIVARELRVPCIIGTKIATKVLKDGDLVEVDADEGVVKILNNKEQKNTISVKPEEYHRLFHGSGGSGTPMVLMSDIFGVYYNTLGCLQIALDGVWTSYLPKATIEKTLKDGIELYCNEKNFQAYKKEFLNYISESNDFFFNVIKKPTLTFAEVKKFFERASGHFAYYSKTEFFYTDEAFGIWQVEKKDLGRKIQEFDEVKVKGREHLNSILFGDNGYVIQCAKILGKQFGIPPLDIRALTIQEILNLFSGDRHMDDASVRERIKAFAIVSDGVQSQYFEGERARRIASQFTKNTERKSELRGTVAQKGNVRGKVSVVPPDYVYDDNILRAYLRKIEKGDILVAETTSPEIMSACKKAGAIVTNQGGLLSHAAIVSRELGIPCIVGVEDATEILKDGDMVEVDADNGTIRVFTKRS